MTRNAYQVRAGSSKAAPYGILTIPNAGLFAIASPHGPHGRSAAELALNVLEQVESSELGAQPAQWTRTALREVRRRWLERVADNSALTTSFSSVVAAVFGVSGIVTGQLCDVHAYQIRGPMLIRETDAVTEEPTAARFANSEIQIAHWTARVRDRIVLYGRLHHHLTGQEVLKRTIAETEPDAIAKSLMNAAVEAGGREEILSVLVVEIYE